MGGWGGGGVRPILMSAPGPFPLKGEMFSDLCAKINVLQDYLLQIYDKYKQFGPITVEYFLQLTNERPGFSELCLFGP